MKKILIYMKKNELAPIGGPKGYVYNLKNGLDELDTDIKIYFLESSILVIDKVNKLIRKIPFKFTHDLLLASKSIMKKGRLMYGKNHKSSDNLFNYDAVHFHSTTDLYSAKDDLDNYRGKVILTSHSPTMPSKEIFEKLTEFEKNYFSWFFKKLSVIDKYAFSRADYIIFPCPEAEEPYYHSWSGYKKFHLLNHSKFRYLLTGSAPKMANVKKSDLLKKYGIPKDAFVITYIGRHEEIKGYGALKNIAKKMLKQYHNLYFLIAGLEEPMLGLKHKNWIEIGWTDDVGSIIAAGNIFILPNLETYFDLVMLEVLSLGQIMLASKTGGNKYFEKFSDCGIFLYETQEEAIKKIETIMDYGNETLIKLKKKNYTLYKTYFTNQVFAKAYIEILKDIF